MHTTITSFLLCMFLEGVCANLTSKRGIPNFPSTSFLHVKQATEFHLGCTLHSYPRKEGWKQEKEDDTLGASFTNVYQIFVIFKMALNVFKFCNFVISTPKNKSPIII